MARAKREEGAILGLAIVSTSEDEDEDEAEQIAQELMTALNWSARIRYLFSKGFKKSSIAFILGEVRGYPMSSQHVNNVLSRPLKGTGQGSHRGPGRPKPAEDPRALRIIDLIPKAQIEAARGDAKPSGKQTGPGAVKPRLKD